MLLTGGFMVAEVAGGIAAGSLALLADAGHMLTDCAALALAWMAFRIGRRPQDARRSYGYHRFQVLAAFVNGIALIADRRLDRDRGGRRLLAPIEVVGGLMLVIAVLGLLVNLAAFWILHGGDRENLNIRGAALHVLGDLLGSVAAIVAGLVIFWTGWTPIDPLLSLLVALLILRSAWLLVRRSGHILLEGTPDWLDVEELQGRARRGDPGGRERSPRPLLDADQRAAAADHARAPARRRRPLRGSARDPAAARARLRHRPRHDPDRARPRRR